MVLAVPIPAQESPGNFITGALWNAQVFGGLTFLLNPPIAQYAQVTAQSMVATTFTPITWPTPVLDPYGGYSAANPTRYTPTVAGWYLVIANLGYAASATGARVAEVMKNGAAIVNQVSLGNATAAFNSVVGVTSLVQCNGTTDYFELVGDQNSGGPLNTVPALTTLTALWVHA